MFSAQTRAVARLWWLATRRLWRENTVLIVLWLAFVAAYVYHVARPPVEGRAGYALLLAASALITAVLLPLPFGGTDPFASRRFDLLPIPPLALVLLRPTFGSSFRLFLLAPVWIGSAINVAQLALGPARSMLALLQLTAWMLAGAVAAELFEQRLRRRAPVALRAVLVGLLIVAASVLVHLHQVVRGLMRRAGPLLERPFSTLLANGLVTLDWYVVAAGTALAIFALLLVTSKMLADRAAALPPRPSQPLTLARSVTTLAGMLAPRSPASLAKELGHAVRIQVFWFSYIWLFIVSVLAFAANNPPLLAGTFVLWIGTAYNILGADVPMGGLTRYALLPRPLGRQLVVRHTAVLAWGTLVALAALLLVAILGGPHHSAPEHAAPPTAYILWYAYGASLFLLCTIPGDWFSRRQPTPITLRAAAHGGMEAGRIENVMLWFAIYAGTIIISVVLFIIWSVILGSMATHVRAPHRQLMAVLLTSLTQYGLYAYRHRAGAND